MTASIPKLALSLGVTLALGFAFTPLGCGGSRKGVGLAAPGQADANVPEDIALQIRTCAAKRREHLGSVEHYFIFDVELDGDGEVDSVALQESTLRDEGLELCMVKALRSLNEDALPMHRSENRPRGPVSPESRTLLGQEALGCLLAPPCLLTLAFLIGAAYITVQIYLQASSHPGKRTHHPPAVATEEPPATTMPTVTTAAPVVTTVPTAVPITTAVPVARRNPGQMCPDDEIDRLEREKKALCERKFAAACNVNEDKMKKIACSAIKLSLQQRSVCLDARKLVQDRCFGGKPDAGHKKQIDDVQKGINRCEALKLINCAKGHPMAAL